MKLWLFFFSVPTVTRNLTSMFYSVWYPYIDHINGEYIMSTEKNTWQNMTQNNSSSFNQSVWVISECLEQLDVMSMKNRGLSGSPSQKKILQYITRQLYLYCKPKVAENIRGADIMNDWCEDRILRHHLSRICLLGPSILKKTNYPVDKSCMSFHRHFSILVNENCRRHSYVKMDSAELAY